jgi:signal transduction histidine kinase
VTLPDLIPDVQLTGDKRRNIFLCVKESLNNVLKHSKADAVKIDMSVDGELMIQIYDNGVGIDLQHLRQFGNGLQNIERRMKSIGGSFKIENDQGTISTFKLPF